MEEKPLILIEIKGGIIQRTIANQEIRIVVIDHDNIDAGSAPDFEPTLPDQILNTGEFYQAYPDDEYSQRDLEIRDGLKRNHI